MLGQHSNINSCDIAIDGLPPTQLAYLHFPDCHLDKVAQQGQLICVQLFWPMSSRQLSLSCADFSFGTAEQTGLC